MSIFGKNKGKNIDESPVQIPEDEVDLSWTEVDEDEDYYYEEVEIIEREIDSETGEVLSETSIDTGAHSESNEIDFLAKKAEIERETRETDEAIKVESITGNPFKRDEDDELLVNSPEELAELIDSIEKDRLSGEDSEDSYPEDEMDGESGDEDADELDGVYPEDELDDVSEDDSEDDYPEDDDDSDEDEPDEDLEDDYPEDDDDSDDDESEEDLEDDYPEDDDDSDEDESEEDLEDDYPEDDDDSDEDESEEDLEDDYPEDDDDSDEDYSDDEDDEGDEDDESYDESEDELDDDELDEEDIQYFEELERKKEEKSKEIDFKKAKKEKEGGFFTTHKSTILAGFVCALLVVAGVIAGIYLDEFGTDGPKEPEKTEAPKTEAISAEDLEKYSVWFNRNVSEDGYVVGGRVLLGAYPQNPDGSLQPISWMVLSVEGDRALLISEYVLETKCFSSENNYDWKDSELRTYLNGEFLETAWAEERDVVVEKKLENKGNAEQNIEASTDTVDKVWVLSVDEVQKYLNGRCEAAATPYALKNGVISDKSGNANYWLRTPGGTEVTEESEICYEAVVDYTGNLKYYGNKVTIGTVGVRPVVWVKIK